ncbi:hypothetical protein LTR37_004237 [Vermiconidia calcicola]|uniref:Uncharacterized protein n=1 Tax=Vermiconidia calcicola TaxID=1690605 RepID=A0ACC3NNE8_9PEZI|nr:hypothetical protein LTR37_004237 [Vermiconidia calcicola]
MEHDRNDQHERDWSNFTPSSKISTSHQWLVRYCPSAILQDSYGPSGRPSVLTTDHEVYGNGDYPILFRIGNGGAGYTGVVQTLCLEFIRTHGNDFRIGWVANHSRHSHIALLGNIVQVALTYEPGIEEMTEREGWCRRVLKPAFWDHFILVGPRSNPARLGGDVSYLDALCKIASSDRDVVFHTRGDGSATFVMEQKLWEAAGVSNASSASFVETNPLPPYQALEHAGQSAAYKLTDRATFLTAKADGKIPDLVVYVEGGRELLNPCSAVVNTKVPDSTAQRTAVTFAEWLGGETAQGIFEGYGRNWEQGVPLFTPARREEFKKDDGLVGKEL